MLEPQPSQPRYTIDWTPVRHSALFLGERVDFRVATPRSLPRADLARTLGDAVARLRAVEAAFQRPRTDADARRHAAVTAAVMERSRRVHEATFGYFDPWALPAGFDPAGMLAGWALERAASALSEAGVTNFAITAHDELLVRGNAPSGGPWRVGIRHPDEALSGAMTTISAANAAISTSAGLVIDPHTQRPSTHWRAVTVLGPDLGVADAYATGLRAAGPAGLSWFPTADGYRVVLLTAPRPVDTDLPSAA
ncbi:MAG: FAD:protein FMN transferase [Micromonosporaceae bacterium]|nr:FAD:protein FMN transferase [Micromonosporaceae bacterium]